MIDANKITSLLLKKHADDLCVPECKNGATHTSTALLKMDLWVMKKSWVSPLATCYEIKCSRSDFLGDAKWHSYLQYCNELYFVCPKGVIEPDELPPEVGLMYVASTGSRLYTKKKAQRRTVEIPEDLFRYVLMCRTTVDAKEEYTRNDANYWRNWLKKKKEDRYLGQEVSKAIREHVHDVDAKNVSLNRNIELYEDIKQRVEELGFDTTKFISSWQVKNKLNEMIGALPSNFLPELAATTRKLNELKEFLEGRS